ncbi:heterokaryon incompatibility protein-domain-containing protein, partial [Lasiosphaeria ovina]
MATARKWYHNCLAQHDCSAANAPGLAIFKEDRPARLIQITLPTSTRPFPTLKLVKTPPQPSEELRYAALTYCWGQSQNFDHLLTTANESARYTEMVLDDLPKTLQDAVLMCTILRIQFLWIGSLCILQDIDDDWQREAPKMGGIYANAAITISADHAGQASEGCFNQQSRDNLEKLDESAAVETLYVSPFNIGTGITIPAIDNAVLATRGWTYQERILSSRILHYTKDQLYWECRECILAEDGMTDWQPDKIRPLPGLLKYYMRSHPEGRPWEKVLASLGDLGATITSVEEQAVKVIRLNELWYKEIVANNYCKRHLTRSSDKLIAVSAIARAIGSLWSPWGPSYFYGLWTCRFEEAVLFTRTAAAASPPIVRPPNNDAKHRRPTWTWAGHDFP